MKKTIILWMVFLLFCTTVIAQNKKEMLKEIDNSIEQIDAFINFTGMRIGLSSAADEKFDPKDEYNFENINTTVSQESLQIFFDESEMRHSMVYPYNFLELKLPDYKLANYLGKDNFYFSNRENELPRYTPQEFIFLDGSKLNAAGHYTTPQLLKEKYRHTVTQNGESWEELDTLKMSAIEKYTAEQSSGFGWPFTVYSPKPLQSVRFSIKLPVRKTTTYQPEAGSKEIKTPNGDILLDTVSGNEIAFRIPLALENRAKVYAYYSDGRILREKNSNKNSVFGKEQMEMLRLLKSTLQEGYKKVEKNEISDSTILRKFVELKMPTGMSNNISPSYTAVRITFSGPVKRLAFVVDGENADTLLFNTTYKINYYLDSALAYRTAGDFETNKTGVLSNEGKWLVQPKFDKYFRMCNAYFFTDQIDERENIYRFDPKTKSLEKVNYRLDDYEVFFDKYVKTETHLNGPIGVVDATSGKIVLPMKHDFLNLKEDKVWVGRIGNKNGAYDRGFNLLMPFEFYNLKYDNGFFYATKTESENKDVYSLQGKNLTRGRFQDIEGTFSDGRLLVRTYKKDKNSYITDVKYFFIDEEGNIKMDIASQGFSEAKIFRNGLAAVKQAKTNLYGFIDPQGKLVLSCNYKDVHFGFFPESGYAPVELEDGRNALIDKQGKVMKTFGGFNTLVFGKDSKSHRIKDDKGKWYDAFGNETKP